MFICLWQVLIWSTWAIMGMAFIIAFLAYNAFPDHSSRSSWCKLHPNMYC